MVGLRDWVTVKEGKVEECDILEVYSAIEIDQLKQRPNFPSDFMDDSMRDIFGSSKAGKKTDEFIITMEEEVEIRPQLLPEDAELMGTGEEIDINDI